MQETICTIPINDIFAETDGCPICRMYKMIEKQYVEYITGAAMMAPDVRVETNKKGFSKIEKPFFVCFRLISFYFLLYSC